MQMFLYPFFPGTKRIAWLTSHRANPVCQSASKLLPDWNTLDQAWKQWSAMNFGFPKRVCFYFCHFRLKALWTQTMRKFYTSTLPGAGFDPGKRFPLIDNPMASWTNTDHAVSIVSGNNTFRLHSFPHVSVDAFSPVVSVVGWTAELLINIIVRKAA